ncbi:T9SS type A sorting domain-containing protein, partial [bacterium]|nr:T9SS type A sorting domain-containing protein [bacterium]
VEVSQPDLNNTYVNPEKCYLASHQELIGLNHQWGSFFSQYPGNWQIYLNPISNSPHRITGNIIPLNIRTLNESSLQSALSEFLNNFKDLIQCNPDELRLYRLEPIGKTWYATYWQYYNGTQVYGSRLELRVSDDGNLFLITSTLKSLPEALPSALLSSEEALSIAAQELGYQGTPREIIEHDQIIFPQANPGYYTFYRAYWLEISVDEPLGKWEYIIDANSGSILRKLNNLRFTSVSGTMTGWIHRQYASDPLEEAIMPHIRTFIGTSSGYADGEGYYSFSGLSGTGWDFYTELNGRYCDVENEDEPDRYFLGEVSYPDTIYDFTWTTSYADDDELNAYYHTTFIHDYVKNTLHYNGMDYRINCYIRVGNNYENAYYDGRDINFGEGGSYCYNFALFAEIIYHEYTHGVTHHIYPVGSLPYEGEPGAMDECFSDYFACSVTGDPDVAEGIYRGDPGRTFRTLNNSLGVSDMVGEVHYDGAVLGAVLWEIRDELGAALADSLAHNARFGYPETFEDYLYEVLAVDDDDGNLGNGTPHSYTIYNCFYNHEIGPGISIHISHTPLSDTEDTSSIYTVFAEITSTISLNPDSLQISYSINRADWLSYNLYNLYGNVYRAEIPPQPSGTSIRYYLRAVDVFGIAEYSPEGWPSEVYEFHVGLDTIAPMVSHQPLPDQSFICWPPVIHAYLYDNMGVENAYCEYLINGLEQTPIPLTETGDSNLYSGEIIGEMELGDSISYRIIVIDNSVSANVGISPDGGYYVFHIVEDYFEPVEYPVQRFTSYAVTSSYGNQWHISEVRNHTPEGGHSWKCGGAGYTSYIDLLDAALQTPTLTLGSEATLTFYHKISAEIHEDYSDYAWDGGVVEISTNDGRTWSRIVPEGGYPYLIYNNPVSPFAANTPCFSGSGPWEEATFELDGYDTEVAIRFRFGSDGYVTEEGWYIDDITIVSNVTSYIWEHAEGWLPLSYDLYQNYPNPFNAQTTIKYAISGGKGSESEVKLEAYDIMGNRVKELYNGRQPAGIHHLLWDGTNDKGQKISSGVYFLRLSTGENIFIKKCLLLQ